jgi:hypothetical protein
MIRKTRGTIMGEKIRQAHQRSSRSGSLASSIWLNALLERWERRAEMCEESTNASLNEEAHFWIAAADELRLAYKASISK